MHPRVIFILLMALVSMRLTAQEWVQLEPETNLLSDITSFPWKTGGDNARQAKFHWNPSENNAERSPTLWVETLPPLRPKNWAIRVETAIPQALAKGDLLYLRLRVRCLATKDETGVGHVRPAVQLTSTPYTKEIEAPIAVGPEWRIHATRAYSTRNYAAGTLNINFRLGGYGPQILELKDIELHRIPVSALASPKIRDNLDTLYPVTLPPTYEGRASDAPWRAAANERIERFRKQDLTIRLTNHGKPITGAVIRIEQQQHAYRFGTAVSLWEYLPRRPTSNSEQYKKILHESFDAAGPENDLKWRNWLSDREHTLRAFDALRANTRDKLPLRGHTILWPSWDKAAPHLRPLAGKPSELRAAIFDHARDILAATPYLTEWDVVNEPLYNHEILDALGGRSFMTELFQFARNHASPDTLLYLNEAVSLTRNRHLQGFLEIVDQLIAEKAPFDALGIQCHYSGWSLTPPDKIISSLDLVASRAPGKTIAVTEFDIDTLDAQLQADYLRDFFTAVFSHPVTTGIQQWGFWAGRHWKPSAALWDEKWNIRPVGRAYLDLVRKQWWTQANGKTASDGTWTQRVFKGRHQIKIQIGDTEISREIEINNTPVTLDLSLPESLADS